MTTSPKTFEKTDTTGRTLTITPCAICADTVAVSLGRGRPNSMDIAHIELTQDEALEAALVLLDAADLLPEVGDDGKYLTVHGLSYTRGVAADVRRTDLLEQAAVYRYVALAEAAQATAATDLQVHRDRVAQDIYGRDYDSLFPIHRRAVDRIVELEAAK